MYMFCLKLHCVFLFQRGRSVIAPTPFKLLTEFAGSRTAALGTTVFFVHLFIAPHILLSIFHLSDRITKTRGFEVLVICYITKRSYVWRVVFKIDFAGSIVSKIKFSQFSRAGLFKAFIALHLRY